MQRFISIIIIFLLLFAIPIFAAKGVCGLNFYDEFFVQVLDAKSRPVEGAAVTVHYQVQSNKYNDVTRYTDRSGKAFFSISNTEPMLSFVDCKIDISAAKAGATASTSTTVGEHGPTIDLKIPTIYYLWVDVLDQHGNHIRNATVYANDLNATTDVTGRATFQLPAGEVYLLVKYLDGKREAGITITDDVTYAISFTTYSMKIRVVDDSDRPLPEASIVVGAKSYSVNNDGLLEVANILNPRPSVIVSYKNLEKNVDVDLDMQVNYVVVFDVTPPVVEDVKVLPGNKSTRIVITAYDPGQRSSGIADGGITVHYTVKELERQAGVYISGKDQFVAEIPHQPLNTVVKFSIEVRDAAGNYKTIEGNYISTDVIPEKNESKQTNETTTQQPQPTGFPLEYAIGGAVIVVLLYFGYRYFTSRGEQTEGSI